MTITDLQQIIRSQDFSLYRHPSTFPPDDPRGIAVAVASNVTVIYFPDRIEIHTYETLRRHRSDYTLTLRTNWRHLPYDTLLLRLLAQPFHLDPPESLPANLHSSSSTTTSSTHPLPRTA